MSSIRLPHSKRYDPVGWCIYCARTREEIERDGADALEEEHIVPIAIDGQLILPDASCRRCAAHINENFEQYFLGSMVLDARAYLKMKGRSKKRKAPLPEARPKRLAVMGRNGKFERWEFVDRASFPFGYLGVELHPPTFLTGESPRTNTITYGASGYIDQDYAQRANIHPSGYISMQAFSPDKLCLEIAKISHGIAIAELGGECFEPYLPSIILGENKNIFHFVGGSPSSGSASENSHTIDLTVNNELITAQVRLFSKLGAPSYLAVVGRMRSND